MAIPPPDAPAKADAKRARVGFDDARSAPRRISPGYSNFVRTAKIGLLTVALLLIVLVVAWPYIDVSDTRFRIGFADLTVREAGDPSMVNPRYVGTDDDDQPYSVTAEIARRLSETGDVIELDQPKADLAMNDGTWLVLSSQRGVYGRVAEQLELVGSVVLYHDSGYEFLTEKANINLQTSVADGQLPVRGQGPFGNLEAEGFRLDDRGQTIYFTGKSKLVLYPGANRGAP